MPEGLKQRLLARLTELGASPKRSLGQNFLISEGTVKKILDEVQRHSPASIVEVGPGLGALTDGIDSPFLTLIEQDRGFAQYWRDRGKPVIEGDALRIGWEQMDLPKGSLLLSNLPYQISAPLVIERSLGPQSIGFMVLMFQKEVAQRIRAKAKSKAYGMLSVIAQCAWEVQGLLEAGPRDFYPPPNVASRVLVFVRKKHRSLTPEFLNFVKKGFSQRRKMLIKNLREDGRERVSEALDQLGFGLKVRAEELSPEDWWQLFELAQSPQERMD